MSLLPLIMSLAALSKTALDLSNRARSDELIFVKPPRSGGRPRQSRVQTEFYAQQIDLGEFYSKPNNINDEAGMEMSASNRVDTMRDTRHAAYNEYTGYNTVNNRYGTMHAGGYGTTSGIGLPILPSNFPENYHTEFPPYTRGKFIKCKC